MFYVTRQMAIFDRTNGPFIDTLAAFACIFVSAYIFSKCCKSAVAVANAIEKRTIASVENMG